MQVISKTVLPAAICAGVTPAAPATSALCTACAHAVVAKPRTPVTASTSAARTGCFNLDVMDGSRGWNGPADATGRRRRLERTLVRGAVARALISVNRGCDGQRAVRAWRRVSARSRLRSGTCRTRPCTTKAPASASWRRIRDSVSGFMDNRDASSCRDSCSVISAGPSASRGRRPSIRRTRRCVALSSVRYSISRMRMCSRWLRCPSMRRQVSGLSRRIAMYSRLGKRATVECTAATADTG